MSSSDGFQWLAYDLVQNLDTGRHCASVSLENASVSLENASVSEEWAQTQKNNYG